MDERLFKALQGYQALVPEPWDTVTATFYFDGSGYLETNEGGRFLNFDNPTQACEYMESAVAKSNVPVAG